MPSPGLAGPAAAGKTAAVNRPGPLLAVVGPCGAGKTTLVAALRARGVRAREVAQEHSGVPAMWQRLTRPDLLIFLQVSCATAQSRLGRELPTTWWDKMNARLAHARVHADLVIETDERTPEEVLERVRMFLEESGLPVWSESAS